MKQAKIFSVVVMLAVLSYGAVGFYFLPMASFQGDLTRMAMLPESQLGWHKPQPAIKRSLLIQSSMQDADVLVIGDSFSDNPEFHSLVWQSVLASQGLKVRTESWSSIRTICTDFMPWLAEQGFHGRFVILQIVERNIASGLKKSVACEHMQSHLSAFSDRPRRVPLTDFDPTQENWNGRFSIGIRTAFNFHEYGLISSSPDFRSAPMSHGTRVARVKHGCELFSHQSCNDALFLAEDSPAEIDPKVLDDINTINERLSGVTPVWVFVPNKSTAYLYPDKLFWKEAGRRFNTPNLLHMTQQAIDRRLIDLYPGNNTHFSTEGYLLMGEEVLKALQQPTNMPDLR